jgi:hypothetical protein
MGIGATDLLALTLIAAVALSLVIGTVYATVLFVRRMFGKRD